MRYLLVAFLMMTGALTPATAQVSIGIGIHLPGVHIGINLPAYPRLVRVPGYPVYYAPDLSLNFFFYDGLYWLYQDDNWYSSPWYNGPWDLVDPLYVPVFILRVPVRYYGAPPGFFYGWWRSGPPRWGEHWGLEWERHRRGWDRWDRRAAPPPAPLPLYQRDYSGDRYPHQVEQQRQLHDRNYRYQPRDAMVQQRYRERTEQRAPAPPSMRGQPGTPQPVSPRPQQMQRPSPPPQPAPQMGSPAAPRPQPQPPQMRREEVQRQAPSMATPPQRGPEVREQRQQQQQQREIRREPQTQRRGQVPERDREKDEDRRFERSR